MSQDPEALFARLGGDDFNAYLAHPILSDTDEDVRAVVQAYVAAEPDAREAMLQYAVDVDRRAGLLEIFGERLAVLAVRTQSIEPIRLGLVAMGMSIPEADYQYVLKGLAKLDYSARFLGTDLADVYKTVASFLPEESKSFIEGFLAREDRDESLLKGMGYAPKGTGAEFTYVNASPWDDDVE